MTQKQINFELHERYRLHTSRLLTLISTIMITRGGRKNHDKKIDRFRNSISFFYINLIHMIHSLRFVASQIGTIAVSLASRIFTSVLPSSA